MRRTQTSFSDRLVIAPACSELLENAVCVCLPVCALGISTEKALEQIEMSGSECTCWSAEDVACVISCNAYT